MDIKKGVRGASPISKYKINITYISYDEDVDSLTLQSNKKTNHSVNIDDTYLINLNQSGKIVGIEFLNVHSLLEIPKEILTDIKKARIKVAQNFNKLFINTGIFTQTKEQLIAMPSIPSNMHNNFNINAF